MRKKLQVLAVTGSFAGGKTTCARMFKNLGASVVDADKIYHRLIRPGRPLYKKIASVFGREILNKNKQIDRKRLGKIVFSNRRSLKRLTGITHPAVIRKMRSEVSRLKKAASGRIIIIDAPLLIEAGLAKMADRLVVVKTGRKNQIKRCKKQWGMSAAEATKRIKLQLPLKEKTKLADYVVDNNGTLRQTREQVQDIWRKETGR